MRLLAVLGLVNLVLAPAAALAGHSRHPYFDGGQSMDGRYVVTGEVVETPPSLGQKTPTSYWKYTWTDTKTKETHSGKLEGLAAGKSGHFDPLHAHVFVAPGGETFAVWNPNVLAGVPNKLKLPKDDLTATEIRENPGFSYRLTIYKKTGEIVKRLDLKDFLKEDDWKWLFCYQSQVYWQSNFGDLTRDNAPRVGYALYQISPDYTVLETLVGATQEATYKAKERGITPPAPRLVRVDLMTGKFLDPAEKSSDPNKVPGRPFKGELTKRGEAGMSSYIPSLDPVRVPGKFSP